MQIVVVDYGMGNLHSVRSALQQVSSADVVVSDCADAVARADRVVFPGVGAIGHCMQRLQQSGLVNALEKAVNEKPMLAICVGMQALFDSSEESGATACLGWYKGVVRHFNELSVPDDLTIPHMGWSRVLQHQSHPIWHQIDDGERFYFVHSFAVQASDDVVIGQTDYGARFTSAIAQGNLVATQFHPEKSHRAGLQLLKNFTEMTIC